MPPKDYEATNVDSTNVDSTNVDFTNVDSTNVDSTNVDSTNVDSTNVEAINVNAMYDAMYDNIPNLDNEEMQIQHLQILLGHYLGMLKT